MDMTPWLGGGWSYEIVVWPRVPKAIGLNIQYL